MLEMQAVNKTYRSGYVELYALRDVNLKIEAGEFVALTGPSGSGKTTFLNLAGLLDSQYTGSYALAGINASAMNDDQRSHLRNQKIGFIFQNYNLIPDLTVYENIEVPLAYRGLNRKTRRKLVESSIERIGLVARRDSFPFELSGGQQQRVAIARALAGEPQLILADEPTGNLDTLMARSILDLLEEINKDGATIIIATHDPNIARRAQRNIQIVDGQLTDYSRSPFSDA